jgi:hypothetical protein
VSTRRPAQTAFGRARQATAERPVPSPAAAALTAVTSETPVTSPAPAKAGTTGEARPVVSRFTVRVYDAQNDAAWQTLRHQLSQRLGRMPSLSEVAEIAARAVLDVPAATDRAAELLPARQR